MIFLFVNYFIHLASTDASVDCDSLADFSYETFFALISAALSAIGHPEDLAGFFSSSATVQKDLIHMKIWYKNIGTK